MCCAARDAPPKDINYPFKEFKDTIRFFHFNDVYELADQNEKLIAGGAPRFVTALNLAQKRAKEWKQQLAENGKQFGDITVFSGDLLSPSKISTTYEGEQMVAPFNACKVDVSMPGNHEFDFGAVQMRKMIAKMTTSEYRPLGVHDEEKAEFLKKSAEM